MVRWFYMCMLNHTFLGEFWESGVEKKIVGFSFNQDYQK